ncbi:MAG: glycosyltransferase [Actinomycetota bacterium]|nr:glycosyltransferase [Actinomycetota bacterium]
MSTCDPSPGPVDGADVAAKTEIPYLLVTVGTTSFDDLAEAADAIIPELGVGDGLIQTGEGDYQPTSLPHERFVPGLRELYRKASLVIAHGGAATTFEVLRAGVPLVSVANSDRYDDHQADLLRALDDAGHLFWCADLANLGQTVRKALTHDFVPLPEGECTVGAQVTEYLGSVPAKRRLIDRLLLRTDRSR